MPGYWGGVGGRHRARAAGEEPVETALSTGRDRAAGTAAQLTAGRVLWCSAAVPGGAAARLPLPGGQLLHQLPRLHITAGQTSANTWVSTSAQESSVHQRSLQEACHGYLGPSWTMHQI